MLAYTTSKTSINPNTASPLNMVNHGLRVFTPLHLALLYTLAKMPISRISKIRASDVPAMVVLRQDFYWRPEIKMQPTPFVNVCSMGQTLQLPSRTLIPND